MTHTQPLADLVIDEGRKRLYVVNTFTSAVEVYDISAGLPRLPLPIKTIKTAATPLSVALSREILSLRYLYVACYDGSTLDIIDLNSASFPSVSKQLDAKPQGVAVGFNGKVLISTVGTGTGTEMGADYVRPGDGSDAACIGGSAGAGSTRAASAERDHVSGREEPFAGVAGREADYRREPAGSDADCFVFDAASSIVLGSLSARDLAHAVVSPYGSKFLSGPMLFDTQTLAVLAQQNTTNSPYVFPANANFNVQTSQGQRHSCRGNRVGLAGGEV